MTTSKETAKQLAAVIKQHVPPVALASFISSLWHVEGNKSFKETSKRVVSELLETDYKGDKT